MGKKAQWVQAMIFIAFIALFFILNLLIPDRGFSERENRTLQTAPKFSFSDLFSGKFSTNFENYVTDQFALRDRWTELKARSELASGKDANNGIYLCENETLLGGFIAPETDALDFNLDAINTLCDNADATVYFALIPSASEIWRDKLPEGAPNDSQTAVIDHAYAYTRATPVNIVDALSLHAGEGIFYRTDHHWTTLGAYYGYCAIMDAMGLEATPLSDYTPQVVTDQFYGTTYSSSGFGWVTPDSITTYVRQGEAKITNYPQGSPEEGSLYVESFLEHKDKYSYFYGGNTPLLEIDTGVADAPSLLIIRDSYTDSMSPFLFQNFSHISILDLRYYKTSLKQFLAKNHFDSILVCYSVPNFSTDGNIFLAGQ